MNSPVCSRTYTFKDVKLILKYYCYYKLLYLYQIKFLFDIRLFLILYFVSNNIEVIKLTRIIIQLNYLKKGKLLTFTNIHYKLLKELYMF